MSIDGLAERPGPVAGITKSRLERVHLSEQTSGLGQLAGPLIEVSKGIPTPQMLDLGLLWCSRRLFKHANTVSQLALIGESTGVDNPALFHELGVGRGFAQLFPVALDFVPMTKCSSTISEHVVLFDRTCRRLERGQVIDGLLPLAKPVAAQAAEFKNLGNARSQAVDRTEQLVRVTEALGLEGTGSLDESALELLCRVVRDTFELNR